MPATVDHAAAIDIHLFAYVQATDPGAVGAGKGWVDTSVTPYQLRVRNASDNGWVDVGISVVTPHETSHLTGGSDPFVAGDLLDATARVTVRKDSAVIDIGSRRRLNFIEGANVTLTVADDAGNEEVAVTVATGNGVTATAKASVRVATTAAITLSGTQTIDAVSVAVGDRVLVKNQGSSKDNGIYVCASGAWARSADAAASQDFVQGITVFVALGTANAHTGWILSTADPITLGTTGLVFDHIT